MEKLKSSGFSNEQAKGIITVFLESSETKFEGLATKDDIAKLTERITRLDGELILVKLMIGILLAGVLSLIMKAFFMH